MDYLVWSQTNFLSVHRLKMPPCDQDIHGHQYSIRAYADGTYDPTRKLPDLRDQLAQIRSELEGHDLNLMLVGVISTPEGIAAWALDRLQCAAVRVAQDDNAAVTLYRSPKRIQ
jgi:6-pyruvoyl-tetrahydropterin synthase